MKSRYKYNDIEDAIFTIYVSIKLVNYLCLERVYYEMI